MIFFAGEHAKTRKPGTGKLRILISAFLILLLFSLLSVILLLPAYLDINRYKGIFEEKAGELLGGRISVQRMDLSLKRGIEFVVQGLRFEKTSGNKINVEAKKIHLFFKFLPLIKNRVLEMKSLELDSPTISLDLVETRDDALSPPGPAESGQPGTGWENAWVKVADQLHPGMIAILLGGNLRIREGRIDYSDNRGYRPFSIRLDNLSFISRPDSRNDAIALDLRFDIPGGASPSDVKFQGKITHLFEDIRNAAVEGELRLESVSSALFAPYAAQYFPGQYPHALLTLDTHLSAAMNGAYALRGTLQAKVSNTTESLIDPQTPYAFSLQYDVSGNPDSLKISKMEIAAGLLTLQGEGEIGRMRSGNPLVSFRAGSSVIKIDNIKQALSSGLFHDRIPAAVQEIITAHLAGGAFQAHEISFTGNWNRLTHLDNPDNLALLKVAARIVDTGVVNIAPWQDMEKLSGAVFFKEGTLSFADVTLEYQQCRVKRLSGAIVDVASSPDIELNGTADINVEDAVKITEKLFPDYALHDITNPSGEASLDIKVRGNPAEITSLSYEGTLRFKGAGFLYGDAGIPFTDIRGEISFTPDKITSPGLQWKTGASPFTVRGMMDNLQKNKRFDLTIQTTAPGNARKLFRLLRREDIFARDDTWTGKATLKGREGDISVSAAMDLSNVSYRYGNRIKKERGVQHRITFDGNISGTGDSIALRSFSLLIGNSSLQGSGDIGLSGAFAYTVHLSSKRIEANDLLKLISLPEGQADGTISGKVVLSGEGEEWEKIGVTGNISIRNASFKAAKGESDIRELNTRLTLSGDTISIPSLTCAIDGGRVTASGEIKGFTQPRLSFTLHADTLNLDKIFPGGSEAVSSEAVSSEAVSKEEPGKEVGVESTKTESQWVFKTIEGRVDIREGVYRETPFDGLKTHFSFGERFVNVDSFSVNMFQGKISGKGGIRRENDSGFTLDLDMEGVKTKKIAEKMGLKELDEIEGTGTIHLSIRGEGKTGEEIKKNLEGQATFTLRNGIIHRFTVVSKIFSLLNISQLFKGRLPDLSTEGMRYNHISASFTIQNGIAKTEDFLIDSDSIRLTGIGEIMLWDNTMDMTVGVQPFQTIDKVISSIPLIGRILTGEKKSLIVSYYSVKGDMAKPEVTALPVESVGNIISGIFQRLFTLPVDLIKKQ